MRIIRSLNDLKKLERPTALAIGIFDGIHKGHRSVIQNALEDARAENLLGAVLTFRTFGDNIVKKGVYTEKIISEEMFFKILEDMGVDIVIALPFEEIRELEPEEFVDKILKQKLDAKFVSCGRDFHFGKNASGDWKELEKLGSVNDFKVRAAKLVVYQGDIISSTRIRECLRQGKIPEANDMLGHRYAISFKVVGGNRIGRTLGKPTINQPYPKGYVLPKFGVYATIAKVDGVSYTAVTNVGVKPTVGSEVVLAETYIQGYQGDLYGDKIKVEFLQFLRKEEKFDNLDDLKERIEKDSVEARNIGILYL